MVAILPGIAAFLLYFCYDLNSIGRDRPILRLGFLAGSILLLIATVWLVVAGWQDVTFVAWRFVPCAILALLFLLLLVYTLFFALPLTETYVRGGLPQTCRSGVYALCRHPGVLWLSGFYLFLWLAIPTRALGVAWIVFSVLDILYVVLQDFVIFPKTFRDYGDYKRETPFLLPTRSGARRCLSHFQGRKVGS